MSSYIEGTLIQDERILYSGHISLWLHAWLILLGIVLLPAFGIGLIFLLVAWIKYKTTELAITNKRIVAKFGFISRRTVEININKIESIQVEQSVLGRLFNYGTLIIAGTGSSHAPILGISKPMEFRKAFMEAQDQV